MTHSNDLIELNKRIAKAVIGSLTPRMELLLDAVSVCVGDLIPKHGELTQMIRVNTAGKRHENDLPTMHMNRDYLNFARLLSKDAMGGDIENLIILRINFDQAELLAGLNNAEVTNIAYHYPGRIVRMNPKLLANAETMVETAAPYYSSAVAVSAALA